MRELLHKYLPNFFFKFYRNYKKRKKYKYQYKQYLLTEDSIRGKERFNILFFVLLPSNWKYERIYQQMANDVRFNPTILVCPIVNNGFDYMIKSLDMTYDYFKSKGYNVILAYDKEKNSYFDAHNLSPDIIFYTNPYEGLIDNRYYIYQFKNILKCYVNYGFCTIAQKWAVADDFHNSMWRFYIENKENFKMIRKLSHWNIKNCKISGYPTYDMIANNRTTSSEKIKTIIWAPHHSIYEDPGWIKFSTFLEIADGMKQLAEKYKEKVHIVFKPHDLLLPNLYKHPDWGKEKADRYYNYWRTGSNTSLAINDYIQLFNNSDGMIHDCGSFLVEYLYTKKPALYMTTYNKGQDYGRVGKKALAVHYHGNSINDIDRFIQDVILAGKDSKQKKRESFFTQYLVPPNDNSVAENIINDIISSLS